MLKGAVRSGINYRAILHIRTKYNANVLQIVPKKSIFCITSEKRCAIACSLKTSNILMYDLF